MKQPVEVWGSARGTDPPRPPSQAYLVTENHRLARSRVNATHGDAHPVDGLWNRCADKHRIKTPGHNERNEKREPRTETKEGKDDDKKKMSGGLRNQLGPRAPWMGDSPMYNYTLVC